MHLKKIISLLAIALVGFMPLSAMNPFAHDSLTHVELDPVVISLDSMAYQLFTRDKFFGNTAELNESIHLTKDQLPSYSPEEMKRRMKLIPSMMSMDYNADVQAFIDLFVYRKRELMTKLLASSQIYFPLFEEILDKNQMPDELKYLPVIESALNPQAVSSAGATGLWQMMYGTGKLMGLDGNSYYDERRDPVKSTHAGVKYLKQLYDLYGDWALALAAYNSGPGYVNKAIARAGGIKNFWAIKNMLPAETRSYVPTFLAIVYVMHYHNDYKLVSAEPKRELYAVDTVMIQGKVSLKHIAQTLGMAADELQFLNPCLKYGIVPSLPNGYPLNIPVNYFATFESRKDVVMNDPDMAALAATNEGYANPTMVRVAKYVWYKVRKGETLASIAARYGVGLSEIREWNHLKNNYIAKGQNLKILTFPEVPVYQSPAQIAVSQPQHIYVADSSGVGSTNSTTPDTSEKVLYYYEKGDGTNSDKPINGPGTTSGSKPTTQSAQIRSAIAPISSSIKYYKVQSGDSLWSITQHYPGLTIDKLKSDNNLSGKNLLKGQVLKIVL
jgi:membrane-bound lytic murein transglycosylase D